MWVTRPRQELPSVVNLENGHFIGVRSLVNAQGVREWELVSSVPVAGAQTQTVMDGYTNVEDAVSAYNALLEHLDVTPFETPDPTIAKEEESE